MTTQPISGYGTGITSVRYPNNSKTADGGASATDMANTLLNSFHPGGVNMLLTDGSVQFVADGVNLANFQNMCIRNDGQVTTDPW